ncbi:MAG: peptidyl-prolyl cis-trans isomerase [Vicinamibacteraceae bacterium]
MTMLDRMRRHRGWLKWIMGIVAVAMAAFFVPWESRTVQLDEAVADVDGTAITAGEFRRELSQRLQQFTAGGGGSLPPETLKQLGFDNQVLTQLIDRKAIEAEAVRRGLRVTDTEVVQFIQHIPAFRENGQFVGTARYRAVLRAQRPPLREEDFEREVRADILGQKLQAAVTSWVTVSQQEADAEYRRRNEKVKLEVVGFTADQFRAGIAATDAEAQALFTKDPSHYRLGERRKVRYLTVDTQALRQTMTPTPQQVEAYYQANLQQFANPEQIHAQHILLKTADKDAAAVRAQAESIFKEAKAAGADFQALARKYSEDDASKASGGDLGFFGRGSMVKPFEDAAFALAPGEMSGVVQTDFGFHVIKMIEKRPAGQRTLADVKDQITEQLKFQQAQERATALATALEARIKSPADLDAAAKENGLKVNDSPFFQRADPLPEFGPTSQVSSEAFALADGTVSKGIRTGNATTFIALAGKEAPRVPKFEDVKETVRGDVVTEKAAAAARAKAAEVAAAVKAGTPLAAAAKAAGRELRTTELVARNSVIADIGVSPAVDAVAFAVPVGTTSDAIATENGSAVIKVLERPAINDTELAAARDSLRRELVSTRQNRFFTAYMNKAKTSLTINRYPDVIARASGL